MRVMPEEDMEDLVENVLAKLYARYKSLKIEKILPYAYRSLENEIKDYWNKKHRNQQTFTTPDDKISDLYKNDISIEEEVINQDLVDALWNALHKLKSNKQRKIFELKLKGYESEEIMKKMQLSRSAYDTTVFRATKDIKKILKKSRLL